MELTVLGSRGNVAAAGGRDVRLPPASRRHDDLVGRRHGNVRAAPGTRRHRRGRCDRDLPRPSGSFRRRDPVFLRPPLRSPGCTGSALLFPRRVHGSGEPAGLRGRPRRHARGLRLHHGAPRRLVHGRARLLRHLQDDPHRRARPWATGSRRVASRSPIRATPGPATRSSTWRGTSTCFWRRRPTRTRNTLFPFHFSASQAAEHAQRADARRLLLTHLTPGMRTPRCRGARRGALQRTRGRRRHGDVGRGGPVTLRPDGRAPDDLRPVSWELGFQEWAAGSVLFSMGKTRVLVAASVSRGRASLAEGHRPRLGHGGVLDAPRLHERTLHSGGEPRAARRPHAGDPAVDRSLPAERDGSLTSGGAHDHDRLRRASGRCRHAHGLHHGRVYRALDRAAGPRGQGRDPRRPPAATASPP